MAGLFYENGYLRATKFGTTDDDFIVNVAPEGSWISEANVIYLDQPVGVGFSYGDPIITRMDVGAEEFVNFMLQFYNLYPEFKTVPFLITGQSYAGKYIPIFAKHIIDYNKRTTDFKIPLQSLLIGDPFTAPVRQRLEMHLIPAALDIMD